MPKPDRAVYRKPPLSAPFCKPGVSPVGQLEAIGQMVELPYVLLARFPQGETIDFRENVIACNWPASLTAEYSGAGIFYRSHLVLELKRTIMPITCDEKGFASGAVNDSAQAIAGRFAENGLGRTVAFSLHDAMLRQYVFTFSGDRRALADGGMELVYRSMQVLDDLAPHLEDEGQPAERLSRREIECLRWSAAGKSSEEIAIILDLSSHTVDSYLKSAMRKLDSVNRMQAVARAFRLRLL